MKMSRGFILFFAILLMMVFSFLSLYQLENQSFSNEITLKEYHLIQAQFELDWSQNYIENLDLSPYKNDPIKKIDIQHDHYTIQAHLDYTSNTEPSLITVHLYLQSKHTLLPITLHTYFIKQ